MKCLSGERPAAFTTAKTLNERHCTILLIASGIGTWSNRHLTGTDWLSRRHWARSLDRSG
jgi:hypothetical protein